MSLRQRTRPSFRRVAVLAALGAVAAALPACAVRRTPALYGSGPLPDPTPAPAGVWPERYPDWLAWGDCADAPIALDAADPGRGAGDELAAARRSWMEAIGFGPDALAEGLRSVRAALELNDERLEALSGIKLKGRDLGLWGKGVLHEMRLTGPTRWPQTGRPIEWSRLYLFRSSAQRQVMVALNGSLMGGERYAGAPTPRSVVYIGDPLLYSSFLALYEPKGGGPAKGLVVHLTGLDGAKYERPVIRELQRRGWAVLVVPTPSDSIGKSAGVLDGSLLSLRIELTPSHRRPALPSKEKQGVKQEAVSIPAGGGEGAAWEPGADVHAIVRRVARLTDEYLAQTAYAVDAALGYLQMERPELFRGPLGLMGYSMGAITAPTVAAWRERPGRTLVHRHGGAAAGPSGADAGTGSIRHDTARAFDAAVLVAGGADILRISRTTSFYGIGVRLTRDGLPIDQDEWEKYHGTYLDAARLDPYWTAPGLAGRPVLMLHCLNDTIVPASTGRLLYERLGRPERWDYFCGHEWMFLTIGGEAEGIVDWFERAVGEGPAR